MATVFHANLQDNAASTTVVATPANGTLAGAGNTSASSVAGVGGDTPLALTFDGSNDVINFSNVAANGNTATFYCFLKLNGNQGAYDGIFFCRGSGSNAAGLTISKDGGRELTFNWGGTFYTYDWDTSISAPDGEWCMVAVVILPTKLTLYLFKLDGSVQFLVNDGPMAAIDYCQSPKIGADTVAARYINGAIAVCHIDNAAMTEAQLQAVWDGRLAILEGAVVPADGSNVALTFASDPVGITTGLLKVRQGGVQMPVSAISGSGTSRTASLGIRWARDNETIAVTFGNNTVNATNNSIIPERSVRYVAREFGLFLHFGINTWLDDDISDGTASSDNFAPTDPIADCIDQWIEVAKSAGMTYLCLTTKHVDGFCLWPTATTPYNITASSWYTPAGSPNIVKLFCQKVRAAGLGVGLYFCFWDDNFKFRTPGWNNTQYAAHNMAQVTELVTQFGPLDMVYLDGWGWLGDVTFTPSFTDIPWQPVRDLFDLYQPNCAMEVNCHEHAAVAGPNSLLHTDVAVWEFTPPAGDGFIIAGNKWPAENNGTIRGDNWWFWKTFSDTPMSAATVISHLNDSIARRGALLLNAPPDRSGKIPDRYAKVLADVGSVRPETYLSTSLPGYSRGRIVNQ